MPEGANSPVPSDDAQHPGGVEAADGRGSLDVPEWVSELRRLYVEPKTRASLRQEGAIGPQKRKRGLPGMRGGSRRDTEPAPAATPEAAPAGAGSASALTPPVVPHDLRPAPLEPVAPAPLVEGADVAAGAPSATEEEQVASRLTSYLSATGHADDTEVTGDAPQAAAAPASAPASTPASNPVRAPADPAAATTPAVVDGRPFDDGPGDDVQADGPARSLAELAGLSEPDTQPAVPDLDLGAVASPAVADAPGPAPDRHDEPWRAAHEGAGALVSTGGDAGTPNAAATTAPVRDLGHPVDSPTVETGTPAENEPGGHESDLLPDRASVKTAPTPGRPSTVPPVTLSWREAESFEIGVPSIGDAEGAIVVEAPSQLVAQSRRRRREVDAEDDHRGEPQVSEPVATPASAPAPPAAVEASPTRASTRAASGYRSGKRRRAVIVGLVLVGLVVVTWYFLLRGEGAGSAAPSGGPHTVVVLAVPACDPPTLSSPV